jgi:hypothetical protein
MKNGEIVAWDFKLVKKKYQDFSISGIGEFDDGSSS